MVQQTTKHFIPGCERYFKVCRCEQLRYVTIFLIGIAILMIQLMGATLSGSLALYADSVHVGLDVLAAVISIVVVTMARTHPHPDRLRRRGMQVSAFLLLAALAWIAFEAIERIGTPHPVAGFPVIIAAFLGVVLNVIQHSVLGSESNATARAQRLHILNDILSSVVVISGGVMIWLTGWSIIDPIFTLLVVVLVARYALEMVFGHGHSHHHGHVH